MNLKDSISRIRLYVEDQRTAEVLIGHVRERVEEGWEVFREGLLQVRGESEKRDMNMGLMGEEEVRALLRDVCREGVVGAGGDLEEVEG